MSEELAFLSDVAGGLEVWFPEPLSEHGAALMRAMGVTVHIDPFATRKGAS
jgi:hypothetical protein